ncbi:MAG TPA: DUF4124 domain-containing protein [Steroidobacteraceae bacterium]|nr:DUF4124 domain-containing protein [Steroidobacteraceae bacterium]
MRHSKILAAIAGALICAAAQAGDVYKYVDERGNTLYTDKPLPGAVRVATGTQRPPEVTQQAYATQQAAANRQLTDSNQRISDAQGNQRIAATVAKDLEATRVERCKKARADYQTSIQSRRMYNVDKDGKRTYLDDAQLSQQRVEAAKQVEAICGPQG